MKSLMHRGFVLGQRAGIDLLPRHFYSEIPAIHTLMRERKWRKPYPMIGVAGVKCDEQLAFVRSSCPEPVASELIERRIHDHACRRNGTRGFGEVEADFLFCFVMSRRPRRIVQIGCGVSTAVCLLAAAEANYRPEIICIEPYPNRFLKEADERGEVRLIRSKVEDLESNIAEQVDTSDLFFVDSTHTLGPAGEVTRIVLEMLPALPAGAWVHFHDITFPYDYSRQMLSSELFFSHETALLLAFLTYNRRFSIAASLSMLHYACPDDLRGCLPNYRPAGSDEGLETTPGHFPSSLYLAVSE